MVDRSWQDVLHLTAEEVVAVVMGQTDQNLEEWARSHLRDCERCARWVQAVRPGDQPAVGIQGPPDLPTRKVMAARVSERVFGNESGTGGQRESPAPIEPWRVCEDNCLKCSYGATLDCDGDCPRCPRNTYCPCVTFISFSAGRLAPAAHPVKTQLEVAGERSGTSDVNSGRKRRDDDNGGTTIEGVRH